MAVIPLTIGGINEAKAQIGDLKKSIEEAGKAGAWGKKGQLTKDLKTLEKQVEDTSKSFDQMNKSGKNLTATFEDIYGEGAKPLTNQISELEDRMYSMAIAGEQNTAEFKAMASQVGKLKGTIIDVDKSIDLLAENRGLSVFSTGLGQVGERLLRLDFEGASRDAKQMNDAVGSLGKLGKQALTGLAKTVGQLSKAFIKMGIALLANPIFLIVTAVIAIVGAIALLMSKLGLLQPILDGIAWVFGKIKEAIDLAIQGVKDFLDWIGLTTFAQEDMARENIKLIDSMIAKVDEKEKAFTKNIDHEIRMAGIQGENTTKLQLKKQEELIKQARLRKKLFEEQIKQEEILGEISDEDLAKLKEKVQAQKDIIDTSRKEYQAIRATDDKAEDDRRKADYEKFKADKEKRLADEKAYGKERLRIARQIEDMRNQALEEGLGKSIQANNKKYERLIEDTLSNEKLLDEEKEALVDLLREQQEAKNLDLEVKDAEKKAQDKAKKEQELRESEEALQEIKATYWEEERVKAVERATATVQADQALFDAKLGLAKGLINGLSQLAGANERAQNAFFLVDKAMAIGEVVISTQREIAGYFASASLIPGGQAIATAQALSAKIRATTSIASIVATSIAKFKGGGGASIPASTGGGGGGTNAPTSTQPATPSFELYGQNNEGNNLTAPNDVESNQDIVVKAYVSETDVTTTQNKIKQIQENATL